MIPNGEDDHGIKLIETDLNRATVGTEFDGVVKKVREHRFQSTCIDRGHYSVGTKQIYLKVVATHSSVAHDGGHQEREIGRHRVQLQVPGSVTAAFQDLIHDASQTLRLDLNHA